MHLKLSSGIWRPFCLGLNVLITNFLLVLGEDSHLHQCVSSYLSDMWLLFTALVPFPKFRPSMMASLDHSMWFHAPFHADQWMLYECESPYSGMHTLQCHYNTANFFFQNTHKRHPIARPGMSFVSTNLFMSFFSFCSAVCNKMSYLITL